ncbi:hypothetical protein JCM19235_1298 [Vibrio maritimus]|uniref:Uncharacterized protein n=1 Tax=Vibrio maritimus TaxID=990268 RepID=A0A090SUL6_9VIBR|nr:hypothetical protein JCM19235_1298 [Vibrio maritimus]
MEEKQLNMDAMLQADYDKAVGNDSTSYPQDVSQGDKKPDSLKYLATKNTTVHPGVLLKTSIFSPVGASNKKKNTTVSHDVSESLVDLQICQREGYDEVIVHGPRSI